MAHIPDGLLSLPVVVGGGVAAAAAVAVALGRLEEERIPQTAILAAMFFVASLFAVPVGPSSVHLLLSGLMGLTIGLATFPAVMVGLLLQALLFGFGGLTTLGVNTINIALPGVVFGWLFLPFVRRLPPFSAGVVGFICAALSVAGTGCGVILALVLSSSDFVPSVKIIGITYLPLMVGEGLITGFAIAFLKRVRPEIFASQPPLAQRNHTQ
ncbi:cobalt transporter CbiM [Brucella sp. 63/311]|uniref:cobalt transporter CbiM n=1 Tax=Brucella sp. 63/311 TaxID=1160235 RepID=UPI0002CF103B|nr:cobalt transporter CbiM [Brucella sp. 63/311]ENT05173.1 cobalamin biosynthesis protein CbiM [Brucella sp. 63/311]